MLIKDPYRKETDCFIASITSIHPYLGPDCRGSSLIRTFSGKPIIIWSMVCPGVSPCRTPDPPKNRNMSRVHPYQMHEPSQLTPFDAKEQQFSFEGPHSIWMSKTSTNRTNNLHFTVTLQLSIEVKWSLLQGCCLPYNYLCRR